MTGHRHPVLRKMQSYDFDWEVERDAVIGKPCRKVNKEHAFDAVSHRTFLERLQRAPLSVCRAHIHRRQEIFSSGSLGNSITTATTSHGANEISPRHESRPAAKQTNL